MFYILKVQTGYIVLDSMFGSGILNAEALKVYN